MSRIWTCLRVLSDSSKIRVSTNEPARPYAAIDRRSKQALSPDLGAFIDYYLEPPGPTTRWHRAMKKLALSVTRDLHSTQSEKPGANVPASYISCVLIEVRRTQMMSLKKNNPPNPDFVHHFVHNLDKPPVSLGYYQDSCACRSNPQDHTPRLMEVLNKPLARISELSLTVTSNAGTYYKVATRDERGRFFCAAGLSSDPTRETWCKCARMTHKLRFY